MYKNKIFNDEPIEKLYWQISEVAEQFRVAPSLWRFWETQFEILKPHKSWRGSRQFTKQDIVHIKLIHYLVKIEMYTLEGAKRQIKLHYEKLLTKLADEVPNIVTSGPGEATAGSASGSAESK